MPEHGHVVCPHCEAGLGGTEATCPDCSGPLFGIAPKQNLDSNTGTTTIDNVAVPTYTPPPSDELQTSASRPVQQVDAEEQIEDRAEEAEHRYQEQTHLRE